MQKPDYLTQLINEASTKAGSDYKLAKLIGVTRSSVSMWRAGSRPCPAGDVALMAEIAGLDPVDWTARAVAAQYAGTAKGERLQQALKKALAATGAAIVTSGAIAANDFYFIRCIND